jgi:hypothetical protein
VERDETLPGEEGGDVGQLALTTDEGRRLPGKVAAPRLRRLRRRREHERWILLQHAAVQLLERRARLDPEPLDERAPRRPEHLERLGLALTAIQREHQLAVQALAQRVLRDEPLELGDQLGVAAEREVGFDALLERREPQLLQARDLGLRERLGRQVAERRAAPQGQRVAQEAGGHPGVGRAGLPEQPLEAVQVDLMALDGERIGARARDDRLGAQRLAHLGDVHLQRLARGGRRPLAPQLVDQAVGGERVVGVQ